MNKRVKKQWIKALRSGKYKKGKYELKGHDTYCCLGVLTDLYIKSKDNNCNARWVYDSYQDNTDACETSVLPHTVMNWAGLTRTDPHLTKNYSCSQANDGSVSWQNNSKGPKKAYSHNKIADLIEKNL